MRLALRSDSRPSGRRGRAWAVRALGYVVAWALVAVPASVVIFFGSSQPTVIASHDAVVSPTLDGYATLDLGPYLPDVRYPSGSGVGIQIDLGKTNLTSYEALFQRYAFIGSRPEGQIAKLRATLTSLAWESILYGALIGLVAPALWLLVGRERRRELIERTTPRRAVLAGIGCLALAAAVTQPWQRPEQQVEPDDTWTPVGDVLRGAPIPALAQPLEIEGGLMTDGTERLVSSALDTYDRSQRFYQGALEAAQSLDGRLRQPEDGDTVALLVSDRHDNVGMDPVSRAIADQGGATMILDAGDDTSTGEPWEAFSLDSLDDAFADLDDKFSVAGNHDHGDFVSGYLADRGWTTLDGEVVDGPAGIRLFGVSDPRSSGLGTWRDEGSVSFAEQRELIADAVCDADEAGERVATLLVHDANSGKGALARGCVDLVLAGHLHAQLGPTRVEGEDGRVGYTYTNGTTGGAAYAVAMGSKLRRDAQVTLVTYRDGRPVGIQPVTLRTVGDFVVGEYVELQLDGTARGPSSGERRARRERPSAGGGGGGI